jgi:ketosteroid isomerase-like protein
MTPEQLAVAAANEDFYAAVSAGDLGAIDELWFPAEWTECVHPGWTSLRGWEAVRESWQLLFGGDARLAISITEVRVRILGDVAWASCLERHATADSEQIHTSLAQATNIFVRHDGKWRMVVHHASPVPFLTPQAPPAGSLVN